MNKHSDILKLFAEAPDGDIASSIIPEFTKLANQETVTSDEILSIIDRCVFSGLASGFGMMAMDSLWKQLCTEEGITPEQGLAAAEPRRKAWEAKT